MLFYPGHYLLGLSTVVESVFWVPQKVSKGSWCFIFLPTAFKSPVISFASSRTVVATVRYSLVIRSAGTDYEILAWHDAACVLICL